MSLVKYSPFDALTVSNQSCFALLLSKQERRKAKGEWHGSQDKIFTSVDKLRNLNPGEVINFKWTRNKQKEEAGKLSSGSPCGQGSVPGSCEQDAHGSGTTGCRVVTLVQHGLAPLEMHITCAEWQGAPSPPWALHYCFIYEGRSCKRDESLIKGTQYITCCCIRQECE